MNLVATSIILNQKICHEVNLLINSDLITYYLMILKSGNKYCKRLNVKSVIFKQIKYKKIILELYYRKTCKYEDKITKTGNQDCLIPCLC